MFERQIEGVNGWLVCLFPRGQTGTIQAWDKGGRDELGEKGKERKLKRELFRGKGLCNPKGDILQSSNKSRTPKTQQAFSNCIYLFNPVRKAQFLSLEGLGSHLC